MKMTSKRLILRILSYRQSYFSVHTSVIHLLKDNVASILQFLICMLTILIVYRNYIVLISACVSTWLCGCVHDNSKNQWVNQIEHIGLYRKSSDQFDIGQCSIKVKVTARLRNFFYLPQYKLLSSISQLWLKVGSCDYVCVGYSSDNKTKLRNIVIKILVKSYGGFSVHIMKLYIPAIKFQF